MVLRLLKVLQLQSIVLVVRKGRIGNNRDITTNQLVNQEIQEFKKLESNFTWRPFTTFLEISLGIK